jgi:hypothetical protein
MLRDLFKTSSIQDLIAYEKTLDISHYALHYRTNFIPNTNSSDRVLFNFSTVYDKYYDFIVANSYSVTLTDKEFTEYKFQPKKLSLHIYESMELWSLILRLNNMGSMLDFNQQTILLPIKQVFAILNEVLILEKNEISANKNDNSL